MKVGADPGERSRQRRKEGSLKCLVAGTAARVGMQKPADRPVSGCFAPRTKTQLLAQPGVRGHFSRLR